MKRLLQRWLAPRPSFDASQRQRLVDWLALPVADRTAPFSGSRFVVVDVETTGLNLMTDSLISIGAVAVVNGKIALGDSYSVVLQQRVSSAKANILLHGISGSEQRDGVDPAEAMLSFLEYLGKDPLVAFHVTFDETMIRRAVRQYLGMPFKHPWLDLAYVMPALHPSLMRSHRVLDDWTGHFSIHNDDRHNAVADAYVTAQLLLVAMHLCSAKTVPSFDGLRDLERMFRHATGKV
ncbi:MAG: 3'-5' exonuclease [Gallionella sp.]|nr:3'-5' exonuclease [Gallionella sp.]